MRFALLLTMITGLALLPGPGSLADEALPAGSACSAEPTPAQNPGDVDLPAPFQAAGQARRAAETGQGEQARAELVPLGLEAADLAPGPRARLLIHLGRTHLILAADDPVQRNAQTLLAVESFTRAAEAANEAGDPRLFSYAQGYLGEIYERDGKLDGAAELTRRALFAAQQANALDALYRWRWQLGRIHRAEGEVSRALGDYRQAVAVLGEIRIQLAVSGGSGEAAFRREVEPVYVELVDLLLLRAAEAQGAAHQALLSEARDTVEDWRAAELRDYFRDPCLDAQRKARPDEIPGTLVIYPIVLPDRVELVVSRDGRLESHVSNVDRDTLIGEVRDFRHKLEKRTTRQYLRPARNLYDWLVRPVESALTDGSVEALVFVPGGSLRTIPFAALYDRKSRKFLVEKVPVAITPGLTITDPKPIDREHVELLAAGITEAVQGYPALDNVAREIRDVTARFPGETLLNGDFQRARFDAAVSEQPFGIVHIASHGEFSGDPSQSFLLAYDSKISMNELAAVIGATRFREERPLELLTLSACRTAAGDDRAALGLAGVALRSGARSALATLWSVNDQASTDLVTEFYAQLAKPAVSRAEALRRAQLKLLGVHHYRHPSYWSPFVLISSWL